MQALQRALHRALAALALGGLMLAPTATAARASDSETAGALVGGSYFLLGLDLGLHSGKATVTQGVPRAQVDGMFGMIKVTAGVLLRVTRFGSEAGLEGTFGLGWIASGAYGGKEEGGLSADLSGGVVLALFRHAALGGSAFKIAGGFGSDHDVDYLYASARLGFGETSGKIGVELGYSYRVGDAPSDATLTEHRIALNARFSGFALGIAYLLGDSERFEGVAPDRREVFQERTMRKGEYHDWLLTLGYAWR